MKWSLCGRLGGLVAITLVALTAATVAAADPGVGVSTSVTAAAAPVTQSVPAPPALPVSVPAAPAVPSAPVAAPAPIVAVVPHVAVPHVSVAAKAKASVTVSKQHKVAVKSVVLVHAKAGKTHAKVSGKSKAQASKHKVTATRVIAATTTGPCAGFPAPPYNCSQIAFDGGAFNQCNNEMVVLSGYFHEIVNATFDPLTQTLTIYHHLNWQKVRGVGDDGNVYVASDVDKDYSETFPVVPGLTVHMTTSHKEEQELVSLGSDPNQLFHIDTTTSVTLDATSGAPVAPPDVSSTGFGFKCTG